MGFVTTVKNGIKGLLPAYFTLVMATGIVSIGANLLGYASVSDVLFWANNVFYGILLLFLIIRLLFYFKSFAGDFTSFEKVPGFFSVVAASGILGTQHALLKLNYVPAGVLLGFGACLWVLLTYAFLVSVTTQIKKPSLENGINGLWLLLVVATQSMSILGASLTGHLPLPPEQILFISLAAFLLGALLYIILITLILYRLIFFPVSPQEVTPTYWINLGAAAITTLAGATFIQNSSTVPGFENFPFFVQGVILLSWALATWWMPYVILLEFWKYLVKRAPLAYTPKFWSTVFCLGMYTVATNKLSDVIGAKYLKSIPEVFIYVSFAVWTLVLLGMLISILKAFFSSPKTEA